MLAEAILVHGEIGYKFCWLLPSEDRNQGTPVDWAPINRTYTSWARINYPFLEVNTVQKGQDWKTTSNKTIVSNHPLLEKVTINVQNTKVIDSPFKITNPKDNEGRIVTLKDYKTLQQQNNFTNEILSTLFSQLDRIKDKLNRRTSNFLSNYYPTLFR